MFLAPDGHEIEIADAAATFLAEAMPIARLHGAAPQSSAALRLTVGEMGWFALALSEEMSGSGLSPVEFALFFREVGRQCGPVDVLAQSLAVLLDMDDTARADLLSGRTGVVLAVGQGLRLLGSPDAVYALDVSPTGSRLLHLGETEAAERPSLDPATPMRSITSLPTTAVATASGEHVWRMGQLGVAAMLIGLAEAALDQIVAYAKVRETFGRKIGSYQAVRHPCADMALRVEAARSQLWYAATALKEGRGDAGVHLDAAKHLANQAAVANADTNIQLHGGIGVTEEHTAHLYLKHALLLAKLFGAKRPLLANLLHAQAEV
ncbi:acyl-CoA dehydrogenase [Brevundimonas sp.]|uniref:acyl-CoA dehydrogenase n=1 Tax=Brevundimonas sp. TaxID=1871086 RepID=UPI001A280FE3|nr:acyl-CoA dehydrogenase [Brevundimonas sp.]MBJ7483102.1 acyl-CoA dehydrogenase family protein [Brevundimonas sp.]